MPVTKFTKNLSGPGQNMTHRIYVMFGGRGFISIFVKMRKVRLGLVICSLCAEVKCEK